ncbi:hypothetical protein ACODT3_01995 [Streptomyces sp. 4.24]|uniref:hypothetical protein n=1 Tax=Streptomyces tritrimontium TaxID=3406573 RepID=UPI003BB51856
MKEAGDRTTGEEPVRETRSPRPAAESAPGTTVRPRALDPRALQRLQARAGNSAVARLVAPGPARPAPAAPTAAAPAQVQRLDAGSGSLPAAPAGLTPDTDPRFRKAAGDIRAKKDALARHPTAASQAKAAQDAAKAPGDDKEAQATSLKTLTAAATSVAGRHRLAHAQVKRDGRTLEIELKKGDALGSLAGTVVVSSRGAGAASGARPGHQAPQGGIPFEFRNEKRSDAAGRGENGTGAGTFTRNQTMLRSWNIGDGQRDNHATHAESQIADWVRAALSPAGGGAVLTAIHLRVSGKYEPCQGCSGALRQMLRTARAGGNQVHAVLDFSGVQSLYTAREKGNISGWAEGAAGERDRGRAHGEWHEVIAPAPAVLHPDTPVSFRFG